MIKHSAISFLFRKIEPDLETESLNRRGEKQTSRRTPITPNLTAGSQRGRSSRGGQSSNLIQSHSVFEAGPAESSKRC
jgi:hypothetical protein